MKSIIAIALTLLIVFIGGVYFYKNSTKQKTDTFSSEVLIRDYSVVYGNKDAKITLVEFFDPACGTCAYFYPIVKRLVDQYDGKLNVVYRYAPFHKNSDFVIALLEASRIQGKFDETISLLFSSADYWVINHESEPELALEVLTMSNLGLDIQKLVSDSTSSEITQRIEQDYNDLTTLGVDKTPAFFVNGIPLEPFGYEPLVKLIESEIAKNY